MVFGFVFLQTQLLPMFSVSPMLLNISVTDDLDVFHLWMIVLFDTVHSIIHL